MSAQVIIRNKTVQVNNIHLVVHPFPFEQIRNISSLSAVDRNSSFDAPLTEEHKALARALFVAVPGVNTLYFSNGQITIQHRGVYSDADVVSVATPIILAYLETQLPLTDGQRIARNAVRTVMGDEYFGKYYAQVFTESDCMETPLEKAVRLAESEEYSREYFRDLDREREKDWVWDRELD